MSANKAQLPRWTWVILQRQPMQHFIPQVVEGDVDKRIRLPSADLQRDFNHYTHVSFNAK